MEKESETSQRHRTDAEKKHADYDRYFSPQIIQVDRRGEPGGRSPRIADDERTSAAEFSSAFEQGGCDEQRNQNQNAGCRQDVRYRRKDIQSAEENC